MGTSRHRTPDRRPPFKGPEGALLRCSDNKICQAAKSFKGVPKIFFHCLDQHQQCGVLSVFDPRCPSLFCAGF